METNPPSRYDVFNLDCPSRKLFDRIGERWTPLVLLALQHDIRRFSALLRRIEGISQKMLTQTLRGLERDGLVTRRAFATVPVTVEYTLTPLGESLCDAIDVLRRWAFANVDELAAAREAYQSDLSASTPAGPEVPTPRALADRPS
ncbi:helix-turn-helix domain-containing protein [Micromonospora polyrhachis]|uniref:DNA-binding HxlR family transcriptional regulator n=1 Tax=Micromonospora polyrhachis TaxID=1282883 RepID=A0A7W7WSV5_9ACTN|nr:helix-turn-helix domain-containing protein [Micromonospora polyrhachis]MBB4961803.1 DNA-binding HxlR family transcriptional regulator [Micromonospora polyrhachis]